MEEKFPDCRKCSSGVLIPLSDYGRDGAPITYKAWVCTNPVKFGAIVHSPLRLTTAMKLAPIALAGNGADMLTRMLAGSVMADRRGWRRLLAAAALSRRRRSRPEACR